MIRSIYIIVTLFLSQNLYGQINLVPNPSFEDTVFCPVGLNQFEACAIWENFGNSPDYFNSCSPVQAMAPPNLALGYQNTHSGYAFAGLITYRRPNAPNGPNYREFVGVSLISPLNIGTKYYISFFVNFSNGPSVSVATNKIGLRLSTIPFDSANAAPHDNFAHLYTDSLLTDSIAWIKISGSIIADSMYNYMILGNFFDDANTDTIIVGSNPDYSYYYFDDVCISIDSNYCSTWTGVDLPDYFLDDISIFPNPAKNNLIINSGFQISSIRINDFSGRICKEIESINDKSHDMNITDLKPGLYYITVYINHKQIRRKILIIK